MITPELALVLIGLVLLGAAVGVVWAFTISRQIRDVKEQVSTMENMLQRNTEFYQGLSAGAVGQGRSLAEVRQDLLRLKERIEQVATTDPGGASFTQAIRMARKGASSAEIQETCGISQVEADLVVLLHRDDSV